MQKRESGGVTRISRLPRARLLLRARPDEEYSAYTKETPIPACVHEYLGALQRLRTPCHRRSGKPIQVPLSDGKKSASVKVEAQEREEVSTPLGKFKAVRYEVIMFNDVLINKKARLYVWLTDDERRLPVQIRVRMQFLIGTIELKLEKQE